MTFSSKDILKTYESSSKMEVRSSVFWGLGATLSVIIQSWCLAFVVAGVCFAHKGFEWALPYIFLFFVVSFLRMGAAYKGGRRAFCAGQKSKQDLQRDLYVGLYKTDPAFLSQQGTGAIVSVVMDAVETIRLYYQVFIPASRLAVLTPLVILVAVFWHDWLSGVIMLLTAPLIPLFMVLIGSKAEKKNQALWNDLVRQGNFFLDTIRGLPTLKVFDTSKIQERGIEKASRDYRESTMSVLRLAFLSSVTLEFFSTVSIAIVAVLTGFRLLWGSIEFFDGFFILLLAPEFYQPLRKMGAAYHAKMEAQAAAEKVASIFQGDAADIMVRKGAEKGAMPRDLKTLSFENVSFSYPGGRHVLSGINFTASAGVPLTVVGPSGVGKSTLFSLLMRFYVPESGRITVDGVDISSLPLEEWRSVISWIPQNPTLFFGTILENLKMGVSEDISLESVRQMCRHMRVDDFIMSLPDGYATMVGDEGTGLSGGQIQRLALVRALLRGAKIILFDEPTASIDAQTEAAISNYLSQMRIDGKIFITITHRHVDDAANRQILDLGPGGMAA